MKLYQKWIYTFAGILFILVLAKSQSRESGTPGWKQCSPMPEKMSPTCGAINNKIYAVQNCSGDFNTAGCVYEYDPAKDSWAKKSAMPVCKRSFQVFVYGNNLYTIGGSIDTAETYTPTVEEYDPLKDTWKQKASMKIARVGIGFMIYKNKVYVIGGFKAKNDTETDAVEVYDPQTDSWETKSSMPTGRAWSDICALNGKLYIFGGYGQHKFQSIVEEYDPAADTWTKKRPTPHKEPLKYAGIVNGEIYTIFSRVRNGNAYLERYNAVEDSWTSLAAPPQSPIFDFAGLVDGQFLYVVSGFQNHPNNVIKAVQRYDVLQNKWELLPDLTYGRVSMGAEIIDHTIYVIGGQFGWYTNPIVYTESVEKLELAGLINIKN